MTIELCDRELDRYLELGQKAPEEIEELLAEKGSAIPLEECEIGVPLMVVDSSQCMWARNSDSFCLVVSCQERNLVGEANALDDGSYFRWRI